MGQGALSLAWKGHGVGMEHLATHRASCDSGDGLHLILRHLHGLEYFGELAPLVRCLAVWIRYLLTRPCSPDPQTWLRSAAALGKMHWQHVNSANSAQPYAYGSHASITSNGKLRIEIVEAKWPELNEYIAQLKQATQKASTGNSELYSWRTSVSVGDVNVPNQTG
jgi:hypothetical protein